MHHHALFNPGHLPGRIGQAEGSGKWYLLPLQTLHTFEGFINVGLNTYLHGWFDLLTLLP